MPHTVFNGVSEPATVNGTAGSPVASTSKVTLDDQPVQASPQAVFKKRNRDKKRALSVSNGQANKVGAGLSVNGTSTKRVKTFYDSADDSDTAPDGGKNATRINENGVESRKEARQARKRQLSDQAAHLLPARQNLPVWHAREAILKEIEARDTVVVLGETGSGKTTRKALFRRVRRGYR